MFEDIASLEAHIDACAGNQVGSSLQCTCGLMLTNSLFRSKLQLKRVTSVPSAGQRGRC